MTANPKSPEFRILVLAPVGKDAALAQEVLNRAGITCSACSDLDQVCRELDLGGGALLLTEEALYTDQRRKFDEWLAGQPRWSDLPVLVLARSGADSAAVAEAMELLGNVTVLERPTRVTSLVSAIRTALRTRQRQYETREHLARIERNESELRDFFDNASVGLHCVGPDGIILRVNQAELDMLGYRREEYVGRHIAEFHVNRKVIEDILARLARGETLRECTAQMRCKDSSIRDVLINSNVLFENGEFIHTRCFTRDVTALNRAVEVQSMLAAIIEASDDAIISKTLEGIIRSWNAGAERLFGYTAAEAIGQSIELIIPPELRAEEGIILGRLRRGERIAHFETVRVAKSGRRMDISLTISPVRDIAGRVVGASKVARDVSERKRIEKQREQLLESERAARQASEQANRLKDDFIATVSHELRTPLNGILGWAQLLKRTRSDEAAVAEGVEAIERGARAQAQLIDDLLDMNRIVSGNLRLDSRSLDLAPVIEAALETVGPSADAKSIRIDTVLDPAAGPITGDPTRLQQVIWNLLTNAVKFTPSGGHVQVVLERIDAHARISVVDTGMGINAGFLPHVFERFRQADSSTIRKHGGLGLGLAIVKQIVELHGGTVSVASAGEGKGSTFHVLLPLAIPSSARGLKSISPSADAGNDVALGGIRILVVDDDAVACDIMRRLLRGCEATVETVTSGQDALDLIFASPPDLLLCDIGMPGMDGFEVIRRVRAKRLRFPAIALTAFARPEDRSRALQAGFDLHLSKPVEARELMAVVESLIRTVTGERSPPRELFSGTTQQLTGEQT